jgi:small ligand-binding sensory domain FIST
MLGNDHNEVGLIRCIIGINEDDRSLVLAGDIVENGYLRLMHASTNALISGAEAAAKAACNMFGSAGSGTASARAPAAGIAILVSCVGRKLVMGGRVDEEVEAVAHVFGTGATIAGFYSNGEISPYVASTRCELHNQTMTITYLYE